MGLAIVQVDAFTNTPFAGNPAAVCVLPEPKTDEWMQQVAREMNLSETAFLLRRSDGFNLRWFTPVAEVELCGHATLASAHMLWEAGYLQSGEQARFHTLSGLLTAQRYGEWIEMDFPAKVEEEANVPPDLLTALGISSVAYAGKNIFDYLLEVESEEMVRALRPNFSLLGTLLQTMSVRGVMVTSRASTPLYDFVSRFFAPHLGVDEDPVTGSAHCCLAPYWSKKLGKAVLTGYQASARGGVVRGRVNGDRVYIGGQAVTVLHGELV